MGVWQLIIVLQLSFSYPFSFLPSSSSPLFPLFSLSALFSAPLLLMLLTCRSKRARNDDTFVSISDCECLKHNNTTMIPGERESKWIYYSVLSYGFVASALYYVNVCLLLSPSQLTTINFFCAKQGMFNWNQTKLLLQFSVCLMIFC